MDVSLWMENTQASSVVCCARQNAALKREMFILHQHNGGFIVDFNLLSLLLIDFYGCLVINF